MKLTRFISARRRVLLVGPPGIAKTARIHAAAEQANHDTVVYRMSLAERPDIGGCLVPDTKAGITKALPLETLHKLQRTDKPTLLFLDDLGQAPMDVQAAAMKLFDVGTLPDNVLIWGATNRPGDKAGVTTLCEPLRSRFHLAFSIATPDTKEESIGGALLCPWTDELANWCEWAMDREYAPEIVAWHRSTTGRTLYAWKPHADPAMRMPDYRTWETVCELWKHGLRDMHTISSAIGKPTAAEFTAFAALADKIPTPDQVRLDPNGCPVPKDPASLYLVTTMLAAAAQTGDAGAFVTYLSRLPRVFGALLGKDMYRRLGAKLSGTKEWVKWFCDNEELFKT